MEAENNGKIPFLDTLVHRTGNSLKFSVYRKPTNKDDFIHYYSAHTDNVKTHCILGFMLRAHRICDAEFLEEEFEYIKRSFRNLCYPESLIQRMRNKANDIWQGRRVQTPSSLREEEGTEVSRVIVPHSRLAERIAFKLAPKVKLVMKQGVTIGSEVQRRRPRADNQVSLVYAIP